MTDEELQIRAAAKRISERHGWHEDDVAEELRRLMKELAESKSNE